MCHCIKLLVQSNFYKGPLKNGHIGQVVVISKNSSGSGDYQNFNAMYYKDISLTKDYVQMISQSTQHL